MSDFWKGFILTAVPAGAVGVISLVGVTSSGGSIGSALLRWLGPMVWIVTLIVGVLVTRFRATRAGLAGVLAGAGVWHACTRADMLRDVLTIGRDGRE